MADDVDLLNDMMQDIDVSEITKKFSLPSEEYCVDCGFEIPQKRRDLGGVERCVECQELTEKHKR